MLYQVVIDDRVEEMIVYRVIHVTILIVVAPTYVARQYHLREPGFRRLAIACDREESTRSLLLFCSLDQMVALVGCQKGIVRKYASKLSTDTFT